MIMAAKANGVIYLPQHMYKETAAYLGIRI